MAAINRPMRPRTTNSPRGYLATPNDNQSNVVRPGILGRHGFDCALPTRGGRCDCQPAEPAHVPDLRTSGRGITYDLAQILDKS